MEHMAMIPPTIEKPIKNDLFCPQAVPMGRGQVGQPRSARPIGRS